MITNQVRRLVCVRSMLTVALAMFFAASLGVFQQQEVVLAQAASDTYKDVYDGWKWWHVYCYRCHGVNGVGATNAPR